LVNQTANIETNSLREKESNALLGFLGSLRELRKIVNDLNQSTLALRSEARERLAGRLRGLV
jgi:hypothetical protein